MSASRTSSFLRNAHNSQFASNISNLAKNVSTDVVDTLCRDKRQPGCEEDLAASFLSQAAFFSDFDGGMGEFGLEDLEQLDVPALYEGDGDSYPVAMDVLSFGTAAAPAPGPSVMAPAPAPLAGNPFNVGNLMSSSSSCDDPFGGDVFSLKSLLSQQALLSPRPSDSLRKSTTAPAPAAAGGVTNAFKSSRRRSSGSPKAPTKVKRAQARPGSVVSRSKPAGMGMPSLKATKLTRESTATQPAAQAAPTEDLDDEKDEREYQAKLATAAAAGDKALIREIKNGREKKRRARMCTKFQELHDILNVTNDMMTRFAGLSVSASPSSKKSAADSSNKAAAYEKKTKFKKAQVLNEAVKTLEGMNETFQQMQAQIDALARENQQLKQQHE